MPRIITSAGCGNAGSRSRVRITLGEVRAHEVGPAAGAPDLSDDPERAAEIDEHADRWCAYLTAGLRRMSDNGLLRADAVPERLALGTFASLRGGLLLMQSRDSIEPLEAALDGAMAALRSFRV